MEKKYKIVIINHSFQLKQFYKRWQDLAHEHSDWDITLLAPAKWKWGEGKSLTFGVVEEKHGICINDGNFHILTIEVKKTRYFGWTSPDMIQTIEKIHPNVVYHIGSHTQESLMQLIKYKKSHNYFHLYAFSMRGPVQNLDNIWNLMKEDKNGLKKALRCLQYLYEKGKVNQLNKNCEAIFCHYPDGKQAFIDEGFTGPIFMQTQVGVDSDIFFFNEENRKKIRLQYGLGDAFVFTSAVRFEASKGVCQVLDALKCVSGNWKYMLMGSGTDDQIVAIKQRIKENHLDDKVILTGYINWENMPPYWSAADCCVHYTQTTTSWVETFSLSLVQAMITGLPVIGSSSGSVPYQIGPDGLIVDEKDIEGLTNQLQSMVNNPIRAKEIGVKLYERTNNSFTIKHLNQLFYETIMDLENGIIDEKKMDMAEWREKKIEQ